jgi:hypothetical protein
MMIGCAVSTCLSECDERVRVLRLIPMSDRGKDVEILALRHQITVPGQFRLLIRPETAPADDPGRV